MRVLVGCEYSGVVRRAFQERGHEAYSCDLLPSEEEGNGFPYHYQGDIFDIYDQGWDLGIFHPPCTYLCSSGLHWNKRRPEREKLTEEALEFVKALCAAPIPRIALENPIGCLSTRFRKPDQIIQPWQFGHPESKATCLWLKNLPPLKPTNVLTATRFSARGRPLWENQTPSGQNKLGPSERRGLERARTYPGIAAAFALTWG